MYTKFEKRLHILVHVLENTLNYIKIQCEGTLMHETYSVGQIIHQLL